MSMLEKRGNETLRTFKPHRLNALRGIQLDFSPIENLTLLFLSILLKEKLRYIFLGVSFG